MEYLSTKQISELWGISTRRIVVLASEGRIEGAKQIDGRWFIPEGASKPLPPDKKPKKDMNSGENYVFPFLLAIVHSKEQISAFSAEEKVLYDLCLAYERGDFELVLTLAKDLLCSKNPYIRIGALYHLPTTHMYLGDYDSTEKFYMIFRAECYECQEHILELNLLIDELDSELVSLCDFIKHINMIDLNRLSDNLIPTVSFYYLFSELTTETIQKSFLDFSAYEINCRMIEKQGYFFNAMTMHLCLSLHYALTKNYERERTHLKQAIDIGFENDIYFTLAYSIISNQTAIDILKDYPQEFTNKLKKLASIYLKSKNGYLEYLKKNNVTKKLKDQDYLLLSSCIKNNTIKQISDEFGLSRSAINKRLNHLYKKLNVKTKDELRCKYLDFLMN